jgi:hypothetical protein
MLKIRRTVTRHLKGQPVVKVEAKVRGPFATEDTEFDAGTRRIAIELHPSHMVLRQVRSKLKYPLSYASAICMARRQFHNELRKLKKKK